MTENTNDRDEWLARIEPDIKRKLGDDNELELRSDRRWTEFLKDVAWWLHSDKRRDDTVNAVVGLIKYGIRNETDLMEVAGSPPSEERFSKALGGKGRLLYIICDMLFNKYFREEQQQPHEAEKDPFRTPAPLQQQQGLVCGDDDILAADSAPYVLKDLQQQQQQQQQQRLISETDEDLSSLMQKLTLESATLCVQKYGMPQQKADLPIRNVTTCRTCSDFSEMLLSILRAMGDNEYNQVEKVYYHVINDTQRYSVTRVNQKTYNNFLVNLAKGLIDRDYGLHLYNDDSTSPPPSPPRNEISEGSRKIKEMYWSLPETHCGRLSGEISMMELGDRFPFLDRDDEINLLTTAMARQIQGTHVHRESHRSSAIDCFGGVSGSGKTRLAREATLRFNSKHSESLGKAFYSRVNCKALDTQVSQEELAHIVLESLLKEHDRSELIASVADFLSHQRLPLRAILNAIGGHSDGGLVVVNLDEAQARSPEELISMLNWLSSANIGNLSYFVIPTGLDLQRFEEAKTKSDRLLKIHTMGPVRKLGRILPRLFNLADEWRPCAELNALFASLDGVPRLMLPVLAVLAGVRSSSSLLGENVDVAAVGHALEQAKGDAFGTLYQRVVGLVEENAPALFTSLENLSKSECVADLFACVVSAAHVTFDDRLHDRTVSDIVHQGWAILVANEAESGTTKKTYHLELPLLYLHSNALNGVFSTSHLRTAVNIMKSPQKPLSTDDAEALDLRILHARVLAYKALGLKTLSLHQLLGGSVDIPDKVSPVKLSLEAVATSNVATGLSWDDIRDLTESESIRSFISKEKAPFADSGIWFPSIAAEFKEITIQKEEKSKEVYSPTKAESFLVLIQSKRFLSSKTTFDEKLIETEFGKVKKALSICPFILVLVTDQHDRATVVPDYVRDWVVVADGGRMKDLYGPTMYNRRVTAAMVSQRDMKNPTKLTY